MRGGYVLGGGELLSDSTTIWAFRIQSPMFLKGTRTTRHVLTDSVSQEELSLHAAHYSPCYASVGVKSALPFHSCLVLQASYVGWHGETYCKGDGEDEIRISLGVSKEIGNFSARVGSFASYFLVPRHRIVYGDQHLFLNYTGGVGLRVGPIDVNAALGIEHGFCPFFRGTCPIMMSVGLEL
jgi:hypothetical protein